MNELIMLYVTINLMTFLMYGIDKKKAIGKKWRISEKTLLLFAFIGPFGGIVGMRLFHHKTRKTTFRILVPLFAFMHIFGGLFAGVVYGAENDTPSSWAAREYYEAIEKGYITEELKSNLQSTITRGEFTELIITSYEKLMGEVTSVTDADNPFIDTNRLSIVKAALLDIVKGSESGNFYPDQGVNREQMIVMFVRMSQAIELRSEIKLLDIPTAALTFDDMDSISSWALEDINMAVTNSIVSGIGNNQVGAQNLSTREQAIALNLRLMKRFENNSMLQEYISLVNQEPVTRSIGSGDVVGSVTQDVLTDASAAPTDASTDTPTDASTDTVKEPQAQVIIQYGVVTTQILNMRSTPNLDSKDNIISKLYMNNRVEILSNYNEWYNVKTSDGLLGYVHSDYIRIEEAVSNQPEAEALTGTQSEIVAQIIEYAKKFLGTPYRYGGTSLTNGTDCSNYTKQVMANYGIVLNRSSAGQYSNGVHVDSENIAPGDLVFYGYSGNISHVAIYIGNGQVIHATTTAGVMITPVYGWMNKPFIGVRRVVF